MPSLSSFCAVEKPFMPFSIRNAVMPRAPGVRIGLGIDHDGLGDRPVGDPELRAVEDVAVALLVGAGAHRNDVGAGAGFRHRQRADVLAGNQLGQVFLALRVVAVAADLVDAEVGVRAVGQADRGRGAGDFLHRHAMGEIAHAGAAPFLLDGDAEQAERAELRPQIAREGVGAVDLVGARRDLVLREVLARCRAACRRRRQGRNPGPARHWRSWALPGLNRCFGHYGRAERQGCQLAPATAAAARLSAISRSSASRGPGTANR